MLDSVQAIFREVLDDDQIVLSETTQACDIEGWDSMMHVTLMMRVERVFGVRFRASDISGLKNVGDLVALLKRLEGHS